jgi:mannosyltransferase OCH1-like enzyme
MNSIPKTIHQIWIGPNSEPTMWTNTFKIDYINLYPDYVYKLWTDNDILELFENFPVVKIVYDLEETWNGKSDILRYLILYKYGGIYIDADCVWLNNKSFDDLIVQSTGFFAAIEPDTQHLVGSVIGSYKENTVFLALIRQIESYIINKEGKIVPRYYTNKRKTLGVVKLLGPKLFDHYAKRTNITVYPSIYFYPTSWHGITDTEYHLKHKMPESSYMFQYGYSTNKLNSSDRNCSINF